MGEEKGSRRLSGGGVHALDSRRAGNRSGRGGLEAQVGACATDRDPGDEDSGLSEGALAAADGPTITEQVEGGTQRPPAQPRVRTGLTATPPDGENGLQNAYALAHGDIRIVAEPSTLQVSKDMLTSPGGTAIAGLHTLESGGLRRTLIDAVEAATARAVAARAAILGEQMAQKLRR